MQDSINRFRQAAIEKGDFSTPSSTDHALFETLRLSYLELRAGSSRPPACLLDLLDDPSPHVRLWAASGLAAEQVPEAVQVLHDLSASHGFVGFTARKCLEQISAGELQSPFKALSNK